MHGIKDVIVNLNMFMHSGSLDQPHCYRRFFVEYRIEVTALLQQREDLTTDQAIAFADIFEQDMAKADTYMELICVNVQKLWVWRELVKLGFPVCSETE